MYKLLDEDIVLLKKLLEMKDWNEEDGYSKQVVIDAVNSNDELDEDTLNQIRNYVMDKNLEYGFENDEPNELGYATEELADRLYDIMEDNLTDK